MRGPVGSRHAWQRGGDPSAGGSFGGGVHEAERGSLPRRERSGARRTAGGHHRQPPDRHVRRTPPHAPTSSISCASTASTFASRKAKPSTSASRADGTGRQHHRDQGWRQRRRASALVAHYDSRARSARRHGRWDGRRGESGGGTAAGGAAARAPLAGGAPHRRRGDRADGRGPRDRRRRAAQPHSRVSESRIDGRERARASCSSRGRATSRWCARGLRSPRAARVVVRARNLQAAAERHRLQRVSRGRHAGLELRAHRRQLRVSHLS